jgi:chemotaxis protein CheX
MNVAYINPFLESTLAAFETMLAWKLHRGQPYAKQDVQPEQEVSAVIGLTGKARGSVVLGLGREAAIQATEVLLLQRPPEINSDVTDTIGELVNIVAGGAKAKLERLQMRVGLPTVVTGRSHCIEFPSRVTPICIPFDSDWGAVTVEVGLTEKPVQTVRRRQQPTTQPAGM